MNGGPITRCAGKPRERGTKARTSPGRVLSEIYVSTEGAPIPGPLALLGFASATYRPGKTLHGTFAANRETLPGACYFVGSLLVGSRRVGTARRTARGVRWEVPTLRGSEPVKRFRRRIVVASGMSR